MYKTAITLGKPILSTPEFSIHIYNIKSCHYSCIKSDICFFHLLHICSPSGSVSLDLQLWVKPPLQRSCADITEYTTSTSKRSLRKRRLSWLVEAASTQQKEICCPLVEMTYLLTHLFCFFFMFLTEYNSEWSWPWTCRWRCDGCRTETTGKYQQKHGNEWGLDRKA